VFPLVEVLATAAPVTVAILSTNITNCSYIASYPVESAIVFFDSRGTQKCNLTIILSSFRDTYFYISSSSSYRGAMCQFLGGHVESGKWRVNEHVYMDMYRIK
jgi:hypothetical protein